jgi:hypothetical protein
MREVQQPGDPIPKQEVDMDRSRKCAVFLPDDIERPIDGTSSAVKEDLPWNRCC